MFWKGRRVRAERREERVKVLGECPRLKGGDPSSRVTGALALGIYGYWRPQDRGGA